MFRGQANIILDDKGRMVIPSKFRKHISADANDTVFVTLGRDNCLWLYPGDEWLKVEEKLIKLNAFTKDEVQLKRQLLRMVEECNIDSQHRILIPQSLLQQVGIKKEVLLIGQLDRLELWNDKTYKKYLDSSEESYEDVMEKVMKNNE